MILTNSEKKKILNGSKHVSADVLKDNKMGYLITARMESEPDTSDDDFTGEVEGEEIYYQGAGRFKDKTSPIPETNLTDVLLLSDDALEIMLKNLDIDTINSLEKSNKKIYNRLQQQPFKEIIEKKQLVEFLKKRNLEEDYSKLTELDLSNKGIKRIPSFFKYLTSLTKLKLSSNQISKIPSFFKYLTSLTHLNLWGNEIEKIENLPISLTNLNLGANKIRKIENLPISLTNLDLARNRIKVIKNLDSLKNLTNLYLYMNQIKKIENLPNSLTNLDLAGNNIRKIENLPNSLTNLDLQGTVITKIENLPDSLTELYVTEHMMPNKNYERQGLNINFRL
jgi:Leucine-rich repeat (LRR) protein